MIRELLMVSALSLGYRGSATAQKQPQQQQQIRPGTPSTTLSTIRAKRKPEGSNGDTVTLDFASLAIKGGPVKAGRTHHFRVVNINTLCYSAEIHVDLTESFDSNAAQAVFRSAPPPAPTADSPPLAVTAGDKMKIDFRIGQDSLDVRAMLLRLDETRRITHTLLTTVEAMDCARPWNVAPLLRQWTREKASLDSLRNYAATIQTIRATLKKEKSSAVKDSLNEWADRVEAAAQPVYLRLLTQTPRVESAIADSTVDIDVRTEYRHHVVHVMATGVALTTGGQNLIRTFDIELEQRHRIAFSTGIVATGASAIHYDRVNRVAPAVASADGEEPVAPLSYSTFARSSGGDRDLVNPALLASVSLFNIAGGAALFASMGTTLRNVNTQSTLEPLIGVGVGLLDRLFIQVGAHFGRSEELFLGNGGNADDVSSRAVPTTITRSDAIGTRWGTYLYAGFSIRVN